MVSDTAKGTASGEMMRKAGGELECGPHLRDTAADVSGEMKKKMLASAQISCHSGSHSEGHSSESGASYV